MGVVLKSLSHNPDSAFMQCIIHSFFSDTIYISLILNLGFIVIINTIFKS